MSNYSNGKVGNWRGLPVEVMKEDERFTPNVTTIYAVSVGDVSEYDTAVHSEEKEE